MTGQANLLPSVTIGLVRPVVDGATVAGLANDAFIRRRTLLMIAFEVESPLSNVSLGW